MPIEYEEMIAALAFSRLSRKESIPGTLRNGFNRRNYDSIRYEKVLKKYKLKNHKE